MMITVVSGIPRSGTSLMMQMLQAGGMQLLVDGHRQADSSNPKGYFELEMVKQIKHNSSWIDKAEQKALKIIIPLLFYLPPSHDYKILFMERKLMQIIQSQTKMLREKNISVTDMENQRIAKIYQKQIVKTKNWLKNQPSTRTMYVSFNDLIDDHGLLIEKIVRFMEICLDEQKMLKVIDRDLYRQKV